MESQEEKICTTCGHPKPLTKFKKTRAGGRLNDCMACASERSRRKLKRGMVKAFVRCLNGCKHEIQVEIEEGQKAPPMLCDNCLETGAPQHKGCGGVNEMPVSMFCPSVPHGEVHVYRPGMPEFHERAAQIRHVSEVRRLGTMTVPGGRSVWDR